LVPPKGKAIQMKNEILIGTLVTLTRWRCTTTQGASENKQEICTKLEDLSCVYKRLQGFQVLSNLGLRTSKLSQGIHIADNASPFFVDAAYPLLSK
jgi:hypothetical protein